MTQLDDNASRARIDVPFPAGTTFVADWEHIDASGHDLLSRRFLGSRRLVELDENNAIEVRIEGTQLANGYPTRHIRCLRTPDLIKSVNEVIKASPSSPDDDLLTPAQARKLSKALANAADEVNQMNHLDYEISELFGTTDLGACQ